MKQIDISELKNLLLKAASKVIPLDEAEYYAQEHLEILLRKSDEIEGGWVEQFIQDIQKWKDAKDKEFKILIDKEGTKLIDCNNLPPSLKLKEIQDDLEKRTKQLGIAMTGLFHLGGDDALSIWTNDLAKRGLIALCFVNGGKPLVVPYGGIKAMLGVNPMAYAIPALDHPVIGDFATSQLANYRVKAGVRNKINPDVNAVVDEQGNPTNILEKGFTAEEGRYLPMGGNYKGYEIVFLIEILTGALIRSKMSIFRDLPYYSPKECGQLLIAIDVASLTDLEEFKRSVSDMCNEIRSQDHADFVKEITVPGDRSFKRMQENLNKGTIELEEDQIQELEKLGR